MTEKGPLAVGHAGNCCEAAAVLTALGAAGAGEGPVNLEGSSLPQSSSEQPAGILLTGCWRLCPSLCSMLIFLATLCRNGSVCTWLL